MAVGQRAHRRSRAWVLYWLVFSVGVALANFWVAWALGLRRAEDGYLIPLGDGSFYVFAVI
jgi:hypothetical protein